MATKAIARWSAASKDVAKPVVSVSSALLTSVTIAAWTGSWASVYPVGGALTAFSTGSYSRGFSKGLVIDGVRISRNGCDSGRVPEGYRDGLLQFAFWWSPAAEPGRAALRVGGR